MQFQPPTKSDEVKVDVNGGEGSSQGTDHNGIITGRWKTGIFGFTDTIVPNAVMSCCCPAVSVAQIAARVGMMPFYHVLGAFGGLYFFAFLAAVTHSKFLDVIFWLAAIIAALCCTRMRWRLRTVFMIPGSPLEDLGLSLCCGCCSIAQMASHVESYEPGTFAFAPRETLQGYSFS
ncbi:hypothetical protein Poli38472_004818 [Pythium oligandrum]|uniref:Transmembrane protein n=1 Tax=Pythium oligandrum TaxID=41045 RepID=A0A8K1CB11_PYTOL|nr:hypothetical protein Poli38472_004818 [Pythium oligandrum]|eukprot:TMW59749.1 hypothetical protein Poli38472_004818 [Pythium oligandrum]